MKKVLISAVFLIFIVGIAGAETPPAEQEYQDLDQMRVKLIRMRREMDRFMKDVVGPYGDMDKSGVSMYGQDVRVDVTEDGNSVIVKADLPGMSKDKISIILEKNKLLKLSGSRETMTEKAGQGFIRQERMSGHFERVLELPAECESKGIKAIYNEGVLEVVLPKKKNVKEDTIKVNVQ